MLKNIRVNMRIDKFQFVEEEIMYLSVIHFE